MPIILDDKADIRAYTCMNILIILIVQAVIYFQNHTVFTYTDNNELR